MSRSSTPFTSIKPGVRIVTSESIPISKREAESRINSVLELFREQMVGTGFSFDSEFIVEKRGEDVIFRGGEIIFSSKRMDSTPLLLELPTSIILIIADQMYADEGIIRPSEADSETEVYDIDSPELLQENFRKVGETYGEMIYFVTPRGKLANVERPFMRVSLVLALQDLSANELLSRLDEDMTEDFQLVPLPPLPDRNELGVDTGEPEIPGEVMNDIVDQVSDDETVRYVGMYKGRIKRLRDR